MLFAVAVAAFTVAFVAVATSVFPRVPAGDFIAATPVSAATEPARPPASATGFTRLARQFTGESEKRDPLFADSIGIHAYDRELDDYSSAGQSRRRAWLRSWRRRLAALAATKLSADDTADLHELLDTIDLELFEDATVAPLRTDPTVYTGIIGNAVYSLTARAYAPLGERMANVTARLALLPAVVAAAEANLTRPTRVATLQAIDENAGNAELYAGLPAQAAALDPEARAALAKALPRALANIRAFSVFLKTELLPRSDANPRVGAAVYDRELLLADGTTQTRGELVAAARAQFAQNRAAMLALALPYDRRFFPGRRNDEVLPNATDIVVRRVLDRLANDHRGRDGIFATARRDVEASEAFLLAHPVVVLPRPSTLRVLPTPAFMAGFAGASLDPAGPFTPLAGSYYYIDEIPKTWSAARISSYLRDYNDYEMRILSVHEAVPGHYVQFRYNANVPSIVRRAFANGSFVEGWAVYMEGAMVDAGYGGNDPRLKLFQLKWRLREEANTIVDAAFHTGNLDESQCDDLLEREAFQERSEAQTKWHRLQLSHVQLTSYFVGFEAIRRARAAEQARLGLAFDASKFNAALLAMGSVEPRFIRPLLHEYEAAPR